MASNSKAIMILAVFVFILSLFSLGVFYLSAKSLFSTISGYATSTGEANLTVETTVIVNFTTSTVNWGSGRVNLGEANASLNTFETSNVTRGNWTLLTAGGLRLSNLGNVNVTLNLSGTKTAAEMIGGTNPTYKWNMSNVEGNSCRNATGGVDHLAFLNFYDVNVTTARFCHFLKFIDTNDSIRIDFALTVPSDSKTGLLGDTITATAFAASY